jgi:hypothetical protein
MSALLSSERNCAHPGMIELSFSSCPALVPDIHVFTVDASKDVDGRDETAS